MGVGLCEFESHLGHKKEKLFEKKQFLFFLFLRVMKTEWCDEKKCDWRCAMSQIFFLYLYDDGNPSLGCYGREIELK